MDRYRYRSSSRSMKQNSSFSSTLLDVIYQSVNQTDDNEQVVHTKTTRNNPSIEGNISYCPCSTYFSEAERIYEFPASLRPLRTSTNEDHELNRNTVYDQRQQHEDLQPRAKVVKTKSRAMKIYSYLKKGTQPISPGGRLARFLTSLFNTTKSKISPPDDHHDTIVHADRISKSAVNVLTPRNARYYPATVNIFQESLNGNGDRSVSSAVKFVRNSLNKEVTMHGTEKKCHVEQATRNLLKDYKKVEYVFDSIKVNDEDEEEDDETSSYASSDLFELDHLSTIGIDRCVQELPLYETTSVDVNRAIAKGLLE